MPRKPRNVFEVYLLATLNPLGWEPASKYAGEILDLWRQWSSPAVIAVDDPRFSSCPPKVYFSFYLGAEGPDFVVLYDIPTPESLAEKYHTNK